MGPKSLSMTQKNIRSRERYQKAKLLKASRSLSESSKADVTSDSDIHTKENTLAKCNDIEENIFLKGLSLKKNKVYLISNEDLSALSSNEERLTPTKIAKRKLPAFSKLAAVSSDVTTSDDDFPRKRRRGRPSLLDSDNTSASDRGKQPKIISGRKSAPGSLNMKDMQVKEAVSLSPKRSLRRSDYSSKEVVSDISAKKSLKTDLVKEATAVMQETRELVINPLKPKSKPKRSHRRLSKKRKKAKAKNSTQNMLKLTDYVLEERLHPQKEEVTKFSSRSSSFLSTDTDNTNISSERRSSRRCLQRNELKHTDPKSLPNICRNPYSRPSCDYSNANKRESSVPNKNDVLSESDGKLPISSNRVQASSITKSPKKSPKKELLRHSCVLSKCTTGQPMILNINVKKSNENNNYSVNITDNIQVNQKRKKRTSEKIPEVKYRINSSKDNGTLLNFVKNNPSFSKCNFNAVVDLNKVDQLHAAQESEFLDESTVQEDLIRSEDNLKFLEGFERIPEDELMNYKVEEPEIYKPPLDDFDFSSVSNLRVENVRSLAVEPTGKGKKIKLNRNFDDLNPLPTKPRRNKFKFILDDQFEKLTSRCDMFAGATLAEKGVPSGMQKNSVLETASEKTQHLVISPVEATAQLMHEVQKELLKTVPAINHVKKKKLVVVEHDKEGRKSDELKKTLHEKSSDVYEDVMKVESPKNAGHTDQDNKHKTMVKKTVKSKDFSTNRFSNCDLSEKKNSDLEENVSNTEETSTPKKNTSKKHHSLEAKEKPVDESSSTKKQYSSREILTRSRSPKKQAKPAQNTFDNYREIDHLNADSMDPNSDNKDHLTTCSKFPEKSINNRRKIKDNKLSGEDTDHSVEKKQQDTTSLENRMKVEQSFSEKITEDISKKHTHLEKKKQKYSKPTENRRRSDEDVCLQSPQTKNTIKIQNNVGKRLKSPDKIVNESLDNSLQSKHCVEKVTNNQKLLHVEENKLKSSEIENRGKLLHSDEDASHGFGTIKEHDVVDKTISREKIEEKSSDDSLNQKNSFSNQSRKHKPLEKLSKAYDEKPNEEEKVHPSYNKKINGSELRENTKNIEDVQGNQGTEKIIKSPNKNRSRRDLNDQSTLIRKMKQEIISPGKKINLIRPVVQERLLLRRKLFETVQLEENNSKNISFSKLDNALENINKTSTNNVISLNSQLNKYPITKSPASDLIVKLENDVPTRLEPKILPNIPITVKLENDVSSILKPEDLRSKIIASKKEKSIEVQKNNTEQIDADSAQARKVQPSERGLKIIVNNDGPSTSGFGARTFNNCDNMSYLKDESLKSDINPSNDRHKFKFMDHNQIKRPPKMRLGPAVNVMRPCNVRRLTMDEDVLSIFAPSFVDYEQDLSDEDFEDDTSSSDFLKPEKYDQVGGWIDECRESIDSNDRINDEKIIKQEVPEMAQMVEAVTENYSTEIKPEPIFQPNPPEIPSLLSMPYIPEPSFIPFFNLCENYMKELACNSINCDYSLKHNIPNNWKLDFPKLSTEFLMKNYRFYRNYERIYKLIFPIVAEQLGLQKDFNNLTTLVTDVLKISLATDKAPFINHVINALLKTGFTFSSTAEFVFMSVTVEIELKHLLRDILLTLTVDKKSHDEHWGVIIMLSKYKDYDVDNGIIKSIMTDMLEDKSVQKEFLFKLYHDLIKLIPNQCLKYISSAVLPEFIELLRKHNLIVESDEFQSRCCDLRVIDIRTIDAALSSPSSSSGTQSEVNITGGGPQELIPGNKTLLSYSNREHQNPAPPIFQMSTFRPPRPLRSNLPPSWSHHPPYVPQSFKPRQRVINPYAQVVLPVNRNYPRSLPVNNIYNKDYQNVQHKQQSTPKMEGHEQSEAFEVPHSEQQKLLTSISKENISDILALIMNFKDDVHVDEYLKILVSILLQTTHNYPTFFNTLCEYAVIFNNRSPSLEYIFKTIGVNLILHLCNIEQFEKAFLINKVLLTNYKGDVYNVKLYLGMQYTYAKRILTVARMCILRGDPQLAWSILKEHTTLWQQVQDLPERKETASVFSDLFKLVSQKKHWSIGMTVLSYCTKEKLQGIDLAVHANDIIVNAINNNCSWDTLREFIISNPGWYCFIKPTTFRAIVVKALKRSSTVANQLFVIGQEIEIYPQLIGNEQYVTLRSFYIYEEIQLIIDHFLQNMMQYKPIKYTIGIQMNIQEDAYSLAQDSVPKLLQQFNVTADDVRVRVANVLTNFLQPSILVQDLENRIYIDKYTLNQYLEAKLQT